jgi:hypothetical protein
MSINPRTMRDCATAISDNTFARARARTHRSARAIAIARANTLTYALYCRTRVPAALCACRAWDRHCLLLFVLSFPGHGRLAPARLGQSKSLHSIFPSASRRLTYNRDPVVMRAVMWPRIRELSRFPATRGFVATRATDGIAPKRTRSRSETCLFTYVRLLRGSKGPSARRRSRSGLGGGEAERGGGEGAASEPCGARKRERERKKQQEEEGRRNKRKGEGEEGVGTVARSAPDYLS